MRIDSRQVADLFTAMYYSSQNSDDFEGLTFCWLPDQYKHIRAFFLNQKRLSAQMQPFDEHFHETLMIQCDKLIERFASFMHQDGEEPMLFIDSLENIKPYDHEGLKKYCYDRARFYRWKLEVQLHDFGQVQFGSKSLADFALLPNLQMSVAHIDASSKERAILINVDDCIEKGTLKNLQNVFLAEYAIIWVTKNRDIADRLLSSDSQAHVMFYNEGLIDFLDLAVQIASMTPKEIWSWCDHEKAHPLYSFLNDGETSSPETVRGQVAKLEPIDFLANKGEEIRLNDQSIYLERFCGFFFRGITQPRMLQSLIEASNSHAAPPLSEPGFSVQAQKTLTFLKKLDSFYAQFTWLSGEVERNFCEHSIFSQLSRLCNSVIQSAQEEGCNNLLVIDYDGTMRHSVTSQANGGKLEYWMEFVRECQTKWKTLSVFMTARPQFFKQGGLICDVKEAIKNGDLGMLGSCFLSRCCYKAEMMELLIAMLNKKAPHLKFNPILLDDDTDELLRARHLRFTAVRSEDSENVTSYDDFKGVDFIKTVLQCLACKNPVGAARFFREEPKNTNEEKVNAASPV